MNKNEKFTAHLMDEHDMILATGIVLVGEDGLCHFEFAEANVQLNPKEVTKILREGEGAIPERITNCHRAGTSGMGCQLHFRI